MPLGSAATDAPSAGVSGAGGGSGGSACAGAASAIVVSRIVSRPQRTMGRSVSEGDRLGRRIGDGEELRQEVARVGRDREVRDLGALRLDLAIALVVGQPQVAVARVGDSAVAV